MMRRKRKIPDEMRSVLGPQVRKSPAKSLHYRGKLQSTRHEPAYRQLFKLPVDLIDRILDYLCITDIHRLRRAGAGAGDSQTHQHLHKVMLARVACLHPIWSMMTLGDVEINFSCFLPKGWPAFRVQDRVLSMLHTGLPRRYAGEIPNTRLPLMGAWPPPPSFVAMMRVLHISRVDEAVATALSREMPRLTQLVVGECCRPSEQVVLKSQRDLPLQFAACQTLRCLALDCDLRHVPEAILRLGNLVDLNLDGNKQLHELPEDMGSRLPKLRLVTFRFCPLSRLPRSLLLTVRRNFCERHVKENPGCYGIVVDDFLFPREVWRDILGEERPPVYRFSAPMINRISLVYRDNRD